jgi:hypothetical protein
MGSQYAALKNNTTVKNITNAVSYKENISIRTSTFEPDKGIEFQTIEEY